MTHRRKLLGILIASAALSCMAATGAMYLATARYEKATREVQIERVGYILNRYVNETVWKLFAADIGGVARDIAQEDNIRKAVSTADRDGLKHLLPEAWRRNAVSSGQIPMLGITVYQGDGTVMAEHVSVPDLRPTAALSDLLAKRQGNDRLAQLREQNVRNAAAVAIDNATGDRRRGTAPFGRCTGRRPQARRVSRDTR